VGEPDRRVEAWTVEVVLEAQAESLGSLGHGHIMVPEHRRRQSAGEGVEHGAGQADAAGLGAEAVSLCGWGFRVLGCTRGGFGGCQVADLRFCAYQYQHLPLDVLHRRWRDAERLGFDVLWNCDTVVEPDRARHMMFDGPVTLTLMAAATTSIRVGTLVTSLYFRHPVTLTKAAMTVDHLSGGRVELALGVGDPSAGAKAAGVDWPAGERVARFREFVELVDLLMRQEVTSYHGEFYRCEAAETVPLPVQRPRPPVTIAAHGPKMLGIAAEHGDGWSSWGGYGVETEEDFYVVTAERSHRFDDCRRRTRPVHRSPLAGLLPAADSLAVGGVLPRHGRTLSRDRHRRVRPVLAADLARGSR